MKAEGFGNSKILKIRNDHVIIPRNVKNGHFSKKKKKKKEEPNNDSCDDDNNGKIETRNQKKAEIAETVPGCSYCAATIVARPLRTTVKGGKPAFRKENVSLISPDSRIRRGLGIWTETVLHNLLASLSCPELNLINI